MNQNIRLSNMFFSAFMQVAIIFLLTTCVFAQTANWSAETSLANEGGYVGIAGSGDVVHAAYSGDDGQVMYRRSSNQGASFIDGTAPSPTPLDEGQLFLEDTVMADGDVVAVAYYKNFTTIRDFVGVRTVGDLYIRVSIDGGDSWRNPDKLNQSPVGKALRHSVAIKGQNIYVVWMDYRNGRWDIFYRRSTNAGADWENEVFLVQGMNGNDPERPGVGAVRPQVAVIRNTVHVAWMDGRDNNAWCAIEGDTIEGGTIEGGTILPQCTEIYYEKITYTSSGPTYSSPIRLTDQSSSDLLVYSGRPDIVTDSGIAGGSGDDLDRVYVLYDKRTPATSDNEIAFRKSTDNGGTFGSTIFLTNASGVSTHSSGVLIGTTLYTIWIDDKIDDIFRVYSRTADNNNNLGTEQLVSTATPAPTNPNASAPILGASDDYLHAIWSRNRQILYSRRSVN